MSVFIYRSENRWAKILDGMIYAFRGCSALPVYELDEDDLEKPRYRISPSTAQPINLSVSAWRLAHAVKKADCARWSLSRILWPTATGFLLENIDLLNWDSSNLRLGSCMSDFYADFSRTSLSGRIGQGMALLFLENRGYSYVGRFSTLVEQYQPASTPPGKPRAKLGKSPDFVVENNRKDKALAESKGKFVPPGKSSGIRAKLKEALKQLEGGHQFRLPRVHKDFAIGTFLREVGDTHRDPSLMAYVETVPERVPALEGLSQDTIELPSDAIRRANYASWLSLMGFDNAARRLRARERGLQRLTVPRLTLGEHEYMVTIVSIRPSYRGGVHDPDFWPRIRTRVQWPFAMWFNGMSMDVVGLDLRVVRVIGGALPESELLTPLESRTPMEISPFDPCPVPFEFDGGEFRGSIFSDGSLIGEISLSGVGPLVIDRVGVDL